MSERAIESLRPSAQLDEWILSQLRGGPLGSTSLIARADGVWYPQGHRTLWRRVDRAIQRLRKAGRIQQRRLKWEVR